MHLHSDRKSKSFSACKCLPTKHLQSNRRIVERFLFDRLSILWYRIDSRSDIRLESDRAMGYEHRDNAMTQTSFSRLWNGYETDAEARAARNEYAKLVRVRGLLVRCWTLRDQVRQYTGLNRPDGCRCNVYVANVYTREDDGDDLCACGTPGCNGDCSGRFDH